MSVSALIRPEWTLVQVAAGSPESVIDALSTVLLRAGVVRPTFADAVKARERESPTGLPTEGVKVAIPHTDAVHVIESAVAIGVLAAPVPFRVMGDPQQTVPVQLVFLLAIADPAEHVKALAELIELIQRDELLRAVLSAPDPWAVCELLSSAHPGPTETGHEPN